MYHNFGYNIPQWSFPADPYRNTPVIRCSVITYFWVLFVLPLSRSVIQPIGTSVTMHCTVVDVIAKHRGSRDSWESDHMLSNPIFTRVSMCAISLVTKCYMRRKMLFKSFKEPLSLYI